ncbi:MAG: substrate-binding domain-containing protein [Anaerolineae bacterium]|jgi:hypothetical protein|nr:substrate-binding domain-containing protein [Anaerolineae bacterium]
MMRRSQIVFFLIILSAMAIVAIGFALQSSGDSNDNNNSSNTSSNEPITLRVAVNPVIEPWIREAAEDYSRDNPRVKNRPVTIQVISQDSLTVWQGESGWSVLNHPQVWIPEANYALQYVQEGNLGLRYTVLENTLAQTPIIWGAYQSRAEVIISEYGIFDGKAVQQASQLNWSEIGGDVRWGPVRIGFARPDRIDSGMGALFTLASAYSETPTLSNQLMDESLRSWLVPIVNSVANFSKLGTDPAAKMLTTSYSELQIALLPENQWLIHYGDLSKIEPILLYYPENYLLLDFPFAIWDGQETTEEERQAAADFGKFLLSDAQQRAAGEKGLRPAKLTDLAQFTPFNTAANQVQLTLAGSPISLPGRAGALSLLRWFEGYRTAP